MLPFRDSDLEKLLKQQESKTLEFKSILRRNIEEDRKDPKRITPAVLETVAASLNTEGGDLLIGAQTTARPSESIPTGSRAPTSSCFTWRTWCATAWATGPAHASIPR